MAANVGGQWTDEGPHPQASARKKIPTREGSSTAEPMSRRLSGVAPHAAGPQVCAREVWGRETRAATLGYGIEYLQSRVA